MKKRYENGMKSSFQDLEFQRKIQENRKPLTDNQKEKIAKYMKENNPMKNKYFLSGKIKFFILITII